METDPVRIIEGLFGIRGVRIYGFEEDESGGIVLHIETKNAFVGCPSCGVLATT